MDDYDEFGNYIGQDLDSDDEDEPIQEPLQESARLEGYDDDETMQEAEDTALMQVDGSLLFLVFIHLMSNPQNLSIMQSSYTRTNNTIPLLRMFTVQTWRQWFRKKTLNPFLNR